MFDSKKSLELRILVNGRAVTEYEHEGNVFIEGRKGSEFELEIRNKTSRRMLAVISVDGKNILDGSKATKDGRGLVLAAYQTHVVPGWKLDGVSAAKFTFEDKADSYSAKMAQPDEAVITGVIGLLAYEEETPPKVVHHHHHHNTPQPVVNPWPHPIRPSNPLDPWIPGSPNPIWMGGTAMAQNTRSAGTLYNDSTPTSMVSTSDAASSPLEMGTGFGERTEFKTTTVEFKRGVMLPPLQLYYDSRRNLEKRGIQITPEKPLPQANDLPQAFSDLGCQPPKGWKG
jgi:hypothetical protein